MQAKAGLCGGTEVNGRWWQRYTSGGFLARGNGLMCTDERGIFLGRYLATEPMFVAWSLVESIQSGAFHSGRWAWGIPITKVCWKNNGESPSSGFMVGGNRIAQLETLDALRREHAARASAMG